MLSGFAHLALEVKYLDRARAFYEDRLGLSPAEIGDSEVVYGVGDGELRLRRPTALPRGGLHTHYAFSTPREAYDAWNARLAELDPEEHEFGAYRSLYADDPDDHCVEIGNNGEGDGAELTGIFEIVLEVGDLDAAERRLSALGFETSDRGSERRRVRMAAPFADADRLDVELWEPQLGLADARGGVHVDLGFVAEDPDSAAAAVARECDDPESISGDASARDPNDTNARNSGGTRARDPDGHYFTFFEG